MEKIILVTGGNRGIGLGICKELASKGHTVLLASRSIEKARSASKGIGGNISPIQLDVTSPEDIENAVKFVREGFGRLDVLINNAGIGVGSKGLKHPDLDDIREIFETNFFSIINLNAAFLPLLKQSQDGRIINMSSGMGALDDLVGGYAGYRLSKSGLNAQTILLANELKPDGISVNAMCPGWVKTDMGGQSAPRTIEKGAETAVWLATAENIPTGKFFRDKKVIPW